MINMFRMKLYKVFVSKSTLVLGVVGVVIGVLYGYFKGVMYFSSPDIDMGGIHDGYLKYAFNEWAFSLNSELLLCVSIAFVLAIGAFSFDGYVKNIAGYVQNVFVDTFTDIMVGLILWFGLFVLANVGLILGFLMFFGSDFSFGGIKDFGRLIAFFFVEIILVIAVILLIKVIEKITNRLAATMAIMILIVELVPIADSFLNMFINNMKEKIEPFKMARFELITSQTAVIGSSKASFSDLGITACVGVVYCLIFGILLFFLKRKDKA